MMMDRVRILLFMMVGLLLIGILKRAYGLPRHLHFNVLGNTKLYPIFFNSRNSTVNPAIGDDLIANFKIFDHLLKLLLGRVGSAGSR